MTDSSNRNAGAALWRVGLAGGAALARGPAESGPRELLAPGLTIAGLLADWGHPVEALPSAGEIPPEASILPPIDEQPVWACGVTFERSRTARMAESDQSADIYDRVYDAARPELFLKAMPGESCGPEAEITIRTDSDWDVPEPELGVVADARGRAVAYVLGNDVSSRAIEGENPLYLPQAKIWEGSCAVGPSLVPVPSAPPLDEMTITLTVRRGGAAVFSDTVELSRMRRGPDDLLDWLYRAKRFPYGCVLLTGTSIVPGDDFTLATADEVEIAAPGLGNLINTVKEMDSDVGRGHVRG